MTYSDGRTKVAHRNRAVITHLSTFSVHIEFLLHRARQLSGYRVGRTSSGLRVQFPPEDASNVDEVNILLTRAGLHERRQVVGAVSRFWRRLSTPAAKNINRLRVAHSQNCFFFTCNRNKTKYFSFHRKNKIKNLRRDLKLA